MTRSLAELIGYVGLLAALPVADGVATMTGRALLDRHAQSSRQALPLRARPQQAALAHQPLRRHLTSGPASARSPQSAARPLTAAAAVVRRLLRPGHRTCSDRRLAGSRQPGPLPRP